MNSTETSFIASSVYLSELLGNAERGKLQLPDFQRRWDGRRKGPLQV